MDATPKKLNPDITLHTPAKNKVGFILECTLLYPQSLHDYHNDYPVVLSLSELQYHSVNYLQLLRYMS